LSEVTIPLRSHEEAIQVLGPYDRHARLLRESLDIEVFTRGGNLRIKGVTEDVGEAQRRIEHLLGKLRKGREVPSEEVEGILFGSSRKAGSRPAEVARSSPRPHHPQAPISGHPQVRARGIQPRSRNQQRYLDAIDKNPLVVGVGAAGSGKTFLAVAAAVRLLRAGEVRRIIISRPVVEAGEHLGFLPGDLQAKLNPYLRPIYDALYAMITFEEVARLEEAGVIEIAPLAYMRGRTLSESCVILDEAQNTTSAQMKMFLTRLGEGSRMIVTGDPSQSDLVARSGNGLEDAASRLRGFEGVAVVEFGIRDIVRHPLVERILRAYEGAPRSGGGEDEQVSR